MARKNLTDGKIMIDIDPSDKVVESYMIESADAEMRPVDASKLKKNYYVENIRSGNFKPISDKEEQFFLKQAKKSSPVYKSTNPEIKLKDMLFDLETGLLKFYSFFIGLCPGLLLLQWYILIIGISNFEEYKKCVLRLSQIIQFSVLLSLFASWESYHNTKRRNEFERKQGKGFDSEANSNAETMS